jgi:GTP-binding protein LepA
MDGSVKVGDKIKTFLSSTVYDVTEVGAFAPNPTPKQCLKAGEVGYIAASIKSIQDVAVGDTVTSATNPAPAPLPARRSIL